MCPECASTSRRFGHRDGCSYGGTDEVDDLTWAVEENRRGQAALDGVDGYVRALGEARGRALAGGPLLAGDVVLPEVPATVQPVPPAPGVPGRGEGGDGRQGEGDRHPTQGNLLQLFEQEDE